jgi:glycosyltransferase involved in cell wall biosynthesis
MGKRKISVAIITYNEEKNIKDCLESVRWADEIVVVDGSSQDRTREIAKELGARVIKTINKPFFDINKNMAIKACRGDWILLLDADERISPQLAKEIRERVNKWQPGEPIAYWMKRKNYFLGRFFRKGGQYPDPVIRLFQRGKALMPEETVHLQLKVKGKIGWLKNDLIHLATPEFSRYLLRERRYALLEGAQMMKKKTSLNPFNFVKYLFFRPLGTFFLIFIRSKGFIDGWQGFVFAFFSGVHHAWSFVNYLKMKLFKKEINASENW